MDEKWRVSHVELLEGGACFLGSCFTTKRPGRVFRSAMRITRKRTWAAIMLRQRLRTQSKFSVAELGKPSCLTSEINDESRRGPTSVNELKRQGVQNRLCPSQPLPSIRHGSAPYYGRCQRKVDFCNTSRSHGGFTRQVSTVTSIVRTDNP